ncbi:MAG: plastocyanin/azurin family copper-binding protein [Acidimicrobiia bacterium]
MNSRHTRHTRHTRRTLAVLTGIVLSVGVFWLGCPAGAAGHTVKIKGLSFIPEEIAIAVGDQVTWLNEDDDKHDLTSDTFDAPPMQKGESFSFSFDAPDVIEYRCQIHTYMQGKITVGDGQPAPGESPPPTEATTTTGPTTTTTRVPSGPLGSPVPVGVG